MSALVPALVVNMNPVPVSLPFADRSEAGHRLAERVRPFAITEPLVLALPRGGVPVGVELAQRLDADLDVLMVRKIGLPGRPEAGVGAIAEDGHIFYDDVVLAQMRLPRQALAEAVSVERDELERRRRTYRGERPLPPVAGRDCIVVDDGMATGGTARAALRMVRKAGPAQLVLAVPVAAPGAMEALRSEVDALVVLSAPDNFRAVGEWYRDFDQLSDRRVTEILSTSVRSSPRPAAAQGVRISAGQVRLDGELTMPTALRGAVVLALGRGRGDPQWRSVAAALQRSGYATLALDLVAEGERGIVDGTEVLGERLGDAVTWLRRATDGANRALGVLGVGQAAPAALATGAERPQDVAAVVVHGGRIDQAEPFLAKVRAPVLVLVEGQDSFVRELSEWARGRMGVPTDLKVMSGAEQLLQGRQEWRQVAVQSLEWFDRHLR